MSQVPERFQCRHILTAGHRCGSPALRGETFCYYHRGTRKQATLSAQNTLADLPFLEDRAALQFAIAQVLIRLDQQTIEPRRAGLLLYGLQIAAHNLPPHRQIKTPTEPVEELTLEGLAPEAFMKDDPPGSETSVSDIVAQLLNDWNSQPAQTEAANPPSGLSLLSNEPSPRTSTEPANTGTSLRLSH